MLKLPGWLTTFINVTSMSRFPDGLPPLPTKRTAMNFPNVAIRSPGTWQWMADLLQYWSDVSNTKTQGGLSRTQSALVEKLMEVINPHFPSRQRTNHLGLALPSGPFTGWSHGADTPRRKRPTTNAS